MLIRYSMIQSFLECPTGFKTRYIDGTPDTKKSSALELGTALHLALKSHFEGLDAIKVFTLTWDSLKDVDMIYYRYGWQELRDLAVQKWLPNFIKLHAKKFIGDGMKQEETLEMPFQGHTLQGTYDMYSLYEDVGTVSDWKTSSREYKKNKIEKNPQLYIYAALCKHNFGVLPKQLMYKVFRKDNGSIQTLKTTLTEDLLTAMMGNVANIVKAMLYAIETKNYYHTFECYCNNKIIEKGTENGNKEVTRQ